MKHKYPLHSVVNKLSVPALLVIVAVGCFLLFKDAYNDIMRWIGISLLTILIILVLMLFIYLYRIFDYLVFTDDHIILCSYFRKRKYYNYSDYVWSIGDYKSVILNHPILILTPVILGGFVTHVDTTKYGNCFELHKKHVLYCHYDRDLEIFLTNKIKQVL